MSLAKYTTVDGVFFVEIEKPTQKEIDKYYKDTGEIKASGSSNTAPRIFKKATIKSTWNEDLYPVDSVWIIGDAPGMPVNFFGEKITVIQQKNLYARIN